MSVAADISLQLKIATIELISWRSKRHDEIIEFCIRVVGQNIDLCNFIEINKEIKHGISSIRYLETSALSLLLSYDRNHPTREFRGVS